MEKDFYKYQDYLAISTAFNDTVRIYVAKTKDILNDASNNKDLYQTSKAALGRSLTATLIMGAMLKGDQTIATKIDGGGPIGKIVCEADTYGHVMGYVENEGVYLKYNDGHLAVGLGVGTDGYLTVTKDLHLKELFTSSVPLVSGEIAEDYTYYFAVSEQIPSSVSLGVLVGLNNEVLAAGGFIVQIMPGCLDETIDIIEQNVKKIKPISELMLGNESPRNIMKMIVGEGEKINMQKMMPVSFKCRCSKENFAKGIKSLGFDSINKMYQEDKQIEAVCQYCGTKYIFDEKDLQQLLKETKKS